MKGFSKAWGIWINDLDNQNMTTFDTTTMLFSIGSFFLACYLVAAKLADLILFFIFDDLGSTVKKQVIVVNKQARYGLYYTASRWPNQNCLEANRTWA